MTFLPRIIRHLLRRKRPFLRQIPVRTSVSLPDLNISWACCGDFQHTAKNHCCAVCLYNLLRYLFPNKAISFPDVHRVVGNGPVFTLRKLNRFCKLHSLPLKTTKLRNFPELKQEISQGCPCAVLVANGIVDWHWVLAVGWAEDSDGQQYIRIVDGWHPDCDHWYIAEKDAEWLAAYTFI